MRKNKRSGYTLIELVLVMAIIGIMGSFGINRFTGLQETARDTQRRSDLKQYQTSIQRYANSKGGFFPSEVTVVQADITLCSDIGLTDCPSDPRSGVSSCSSDICNYYYLSDGSGSPAVNATRFALYAKLEKKDEYVVFCSSGLNSEMATVPAITDCPL